RSSGNTSVRSSASLSLAAARALRATRCSAHTGTARRRSPGLVETVDCCPSPRTPHLEPAGLPMSAPNYSLWQLVQYMTKLGTIGFGGPVALVGYMHRDLVEQRKWISEADYKEGLTLAQLMPGPLAAQLAIYLGYVHFGNLGATLAGIAFVLPSFLM